MSGATEGTIPISSLHGGPTPPTVACMKRASRARSVTARPQGPSDDLVATRFKARVPPSRRVTLAVPVDVEPGEAEVIFLPRCATNGQTVAEAVTEAADALKEAVAHRIVQGLEIPAPSRLKKGQRAVPLSAQMSAKAALYLALRAAGLSKSALARRPGVGEAEVRSCGRQIADPSGHCPAFASSGVLG